MRRIRSWHRYVLGLTLIGLGGLWVFGFPGEHQPRSLMAQAAELKVPDEKMNPVGGAVALGHPIGATGAVLTVKTLHELERRQARYGLVTLCIGGGMGIAAVFERA